MADPNSIRIKRYAVTKHGASAGFDSNGKRLIDFEYRAWRAMKTRCLNPKHIHYHRYGGSGITICERWVHDFSAFISDMGRAPAGTTLDRFPDKDGNYEPGNCRWATPKEQQRNMRNTVMVVFHGRNIPISEFIEQFGLPSSSFRHFKQRHGEGMSGEELLVAYISFKKQGLSLRRNGMKNAEQSR